MIEREINNKNRFSNTSADKTGGSLDFTPTERRFGRD